MDTDSKTNTFRDYMKVVYRYKIIFILLLIVVMPMTYKKLQLRTPQYRASVMMMIKATKDTEASYYKGVVIGKNMAMDLATIVKSNIVLERVVEALKLYEYPEDYEKNFATPYKAAQIEKRMKRIKQNPGKINPEQRKKIAFSEAVGWLNQSVNTILSEDSSMFEIIVTDYDPNRALFVANSVSRSYVIFDLEQQIVELKLKYGDKHSTVLQLQNYIEEFSKTLDGRIIPDVDAIGPASVKIIQQAREVMPVQIIDKQRTLIITALICLLISIVIAFGLEFLNQSIRTPHDIEVDIKLSCLGSVAKRKSKNKYLPSMGNANNSEYIRSLHMTADRIYMLMKEGNLKSLLISAIEGAKESVDLITNLGFYLSDTQGLKVLIIDANFRRDYFDGIIKVPNGNCGLTDIMEGHCTFTDAVLEVAPKLHMIQSGNRVQNPLLFLQSHQITDIIAEADKNYDVVMVNSAELRNYGDSVMLSTSVDGVVLIVNEGRTKVVIAKNSIYPMIQKKINILGAILNNRKYILPRLLYKWS